MKYFDAHCHVQFPPYDSDREELLASMKAQEVGGIIVGVDQDSSEKAITRADGSTLFASVGLHPNDTPNEVFDEEVYERLAKDSKVVALGECGLDYFRPDEPEKEKERQKDIFRKHIALSAKLGKPLMIHARPSKGTMDAYEDVITLLKEAKEQYGNVVKGNMHFFVGNTVVAQELLALSMTFSFTAVLTFTSDYDEVVRTLPLSAILSETDAPYVAPAPNRGKRNDPLAVIEVVKAIARIRGEDEEKVREALVENAVRVFALPQ